MNKRCCGVFVGAVLGLAALPSFAQEDAAQEGAAPREIVTAEEQAELDRVARLEAQPVLECEPGELRAEAVLGEEALLTLTIRNAGGRKLEWSVFSKPAWVRVDAERGELGHGEDRKLLVAVDTTGLAPGTAKGRLVVVAADAKGSPATVAIAVKVGRDVPREEKIAPQRFPPGRESAKADSSVNIEFGVPLWVPKKEVSPYIAYGLSVNLGELELVYHGVGPWAMVDFCAGWRRVSGRAYFGIGAGVLLDELSPRANVYLRSGLRTSGTKGLGVDLWLSGSGVALTGSYSLAW